MDKKAIKEFFLKNTGKAEGGRRLTFQATEKLVTDYIEHLTDIEMRKDKRRTDNDRKRAERKQQEYNDIDWEDFYHRNQLSSLAVGELVLYIYHHNIAFTERKER